MRVLNVKNTEAETVISAQESSFDAVQAVDLSYHEMAQNPLVEKDILSQVHDNLNLLKDLQSRVSFVMREVRYVLKV